jgi:glycosyltransferase involved in cell wall biosynthesis
MTHSVIVATMNRPADVGRLLDALGNQTRPPDEIVLADASSDDATRRVARERMKEGGPRLMHLRCVPGICSQRNAGMETSLGDVLTFFDDDVIPAPEYCELAMFHFESDGEAAIAAVGGVAVNTRPVGRWRTAFRRLFLLQTDRGGNGFLASGIPDFGSHFDELSRVQFLATAAASFRRSAVGNMKFDERKFSGAALGLPTGRGFGEDVDFSAGLSAAGALLIDPALAFVHDHSEANRENTLVTQALYVYAMRTISADHAASRAARRWALLGQFLLCAAQSAVKMNPAYLRGYLRGAGARL